MSLGQWGWRGTGCQQTEKDLKAPGDLQDEAFYKFSGPVRCQPFSIDQATTIHKNTRWVGRTLAEEKLVHRPREEPSPPPKCKENQSQVQFLGAMGNVRSPRFDYPPLTSAPQTCYMTLGKLISPLEPCIYLICKIG